MKRTIYVKDIDNGWLKYKVNYTTQLPKLLKIKTTLFEKQNGYTEKFIK